MQQTLGEVLHHLTASTFEIPSLGRPAMASAPFQEFFVVLCIPHDTRTQMLHISGLRLNLVEFWHGRGAAVIVMGPCYRRIDSRAQTVYSINPSMHVAPLEEKCCHATLRTTISACCCKFCSVWCDACIKQPPQFWVRSFFGCISLHPSHSEPLRAPDIGTVPTLNHATCDTTGN